MGRRSKKSRAASARIAINKAKMKMSSEENREKPVSSADLKIEYVKRIRGNFNQGDEQFSVESRGIQCSCNALTMLCKVNTILQNIVPCHLDTILQEGDQLYKNTALKLKAKGQLHANGYIETEQLPLNFALANITYTVHYNDLRYGRLDEDPQSVLDPLDVELQAAFNISERNILILGGSFMAIYKDNSTNQYVFFDSHSRDEYGFPACDGTACTMVFPDLNNLVTFLQVLANRLNLYPRNFGIQPVTLITQTEQHGTALNTQYQPRHKNSGLCPPVRDNNSTAAGNKTGIVYGNKKVASDCCNCKDLSSVEMPPNERLSRYDKWFRKLSTSRRNDILARKRKRSNEQYTCSKLANQKRKRARQTSKDKYKDPKKAETKRQKQRDAYKDPEKAESKRQKSRKEMRTKIQKRQKASAKKKEIGTKIHKRQKASAKDKEMRTKIQK